jgi:hypothetical protein
MWYTELSIMIKQSDGLAPKKAHLERMRFQSTSKLNCIWIELFIFLLESTLWITKTVLFIRPRQVYISEYGYVGYREICCVVCMLDGVSNLDAQVASRGPPLGGASGMRR